MGAPGTALTIPEPPVVEREDLEFTLLELSGWSHRRRPLEPGIIPPAELEAAHYRSGRQAEALPSRPETIPVRFSVALDGPLGVDIRSSHVIVSWPLAAGVPCMGAVVVGSGLLTFGALVQCERCWAGAHLKRTDAVVWGDGAGAGRWDESMPAHAIDGCSFPADFGIIGCHASPRSRQWV